MKKVLSAFTVFGLLTMPGLADEIPLFGDIMADPLTVRPALFDGHGSPKNFLRNHGIDLELSWTQFYQGLADGEGRHDWRYGGKGDVVVNIDAAKLGLWSGLSINLHQEFIHGRDANSQGDGTIVPVNTALAFPGTGGLNHDTSVVVSQRLGDRATLSFGKFNMLDAASQTPLIGGGGIDTFMNTALAAPISGITPPYLIGGSLSIKTKPATFSLLVYDPRNAQEFKVLRNPFAEGVTASLSVTVPTQFGGLPASHSFRGAYSTEQGTDLRDVPQLALPPQLRDEPRSLSDRWFFSYAFQQFLFKNSDDPSKGWGLFGQAGISDGNPNPIHGHFFVGMGGNNLMPKRMNDRWGIGYFNYRLSNDLRRAAARDLGTSFGSEAGVEAFYNLAVTPWFRVSGDVQFINPFPSNRDKSIFAGIRTQIKF